MLSRFVVNRIAVLLVPLSFRPLLVHQLLMLLSCCWAISLTVTLQIPRMRITRSSAKAWTKLLWVPKLLRKVLRYIYESIIERKFYNHKAFTHVLSLYHVSYNTI